MPSRRSIRQIPNLAKLSEKHDVPKELDWDLWLGPAQERPYHPMYVPFNWRGWLAFGTGCIGDWICHVVDPVFWALDLGAPTTIQAEVEGLRSARARRGLSAGRGDHLRVPRQGRARAGEARLV